MMTREDTEEAGASVASPRVSHVHRPERILLWLGQGRQGAGKGNKAGTRQWPDDTSLGLLSGGMKASAGFSESDGI